MKQALHLRQSQRLVMTPQLQQSIRLLQMSTTDLREELLQAQESNPVLEINDDLAESNSPDADKPAAINENHTDADSLSSEAIAGRENVSFDDHYNSEDKNNSADDAPPDIWSSVARRDSGAITANQSIDPFGGIGATEDVLSLKQYLRQQLPDLFVEPHDLLAANHIIDYLDDGGYLEIELPEIQTLVAEEIETSIDKIEWVLTQVQSMDPTGVAARTPEECLLLQLKAKQSDRVDIADAQRIVASSLKELAKNDFSAVRRRLGLSLERVQDAVVVIRSLNPHPGYLYGSDRVEFVVPDILVDKKGEYWFANLNTNALPNLLVNPQYQALIERNVENKEFNDMRAQLQEARWFISNLEKRYATILSVAKEIVDRQQEYFHRGPEYLRPMVLRDVADALEIHESTVSRATAGKYMLTPSGTVEMKYFFSRQLNTSDGESASAIAVKSMIRDLIGQELPSKPISDSGLCKVLNEKGIEIARRTVAKYREQMKIPPSSKRKII